MSAARRKRYKIGEQYINDQDLIVGYWIEGDQYYFLLKTSVNYNFLFDLEIKQNWDNNIKSKIKEGKEADVFVDSTLVKEGDGVRWEKVHQDHFPFSENLSLHAVIDSINKELDV